MPEEQKKKWKLTSVFLMIKATIKVLKTLIKKSKISEPVGNGSVAHLGERLVRNEEVAGSIPVRSTSSTNWLD